MIKTPTVCGRPMRIAGADGDSGVEALPDDAPLVDDVLPLLERLVDRDAVVADVGANVGMYSIALSRLAPDGHVYAFEPSARTFAFLERNIAANEARNVTAVASAMGAEEAELEFLDNRQFSAGSWAVDNAPDLFKDWFGDVKRSDGRDGARGGFVKVPCTTLDRFVADRGIDRLDVMKIDTEGFDLAVVRGARDAIARLKPVVVVEFATFALTVHAQTLPAAAVEELRGVFERLFVITRGGGLHELSTTQDILDLLYMNATRQPVQDLLGLPANCPLASRIDALTGLPEAEVTRAPTDDLGTALAWVAELERTLEAERSEVAHLRGELEATRKTLSWRITAPLRAVRRKQLGV